MKKITLFAALLLLAFVIVLHNACLKDIGPIQKKPAPPIGLCDSLNVKYSTDIVPILQNNCMGSSCHSSGAPNSDLSSYAGVAFEAANGNLYAKAVGPFADMPALAPNLPDPLKQKLDCWIQKGYPNN